MSGNKMSGTTASTATSEAATRAISVRCFVAENVIFIAQIRLFLHKTDNRQFQQAVFFIQHKNRETSMALYTAFQNAIYHREDDSFKGKYLFLDRSGFSYPVIDNNAMFDTYMHLPNNETIYTACLEGGQPAYRDFYIGETGSPDLKKIDVAYYHIPDFEKFNVADFNRSDAIMHAHQRFCVVCEESSYMDHEKRKCWTYNMKGLIDTDA